MNTKAYELKKNMNSKTDEPQKFLNLKAYELKSPKT